MIQGFGDASSVVWSSLPPPAPGPIVRLRYSLYGLRCPSLSLSDLSFSHCYTAVGYRKRRLSGARFRYMDCTSFSRSPYQAARLISDGQDRSGGRIRSLILAADTADVSQTGHISSIGPRAAAATEIDDTDRGWSNTASCGQTFRTLALSTIFSTSHTSIVRNLLDQPGKVWHAHIEHGWVCEMKIAFGLNDSAC